MRYAFTMLIAAVVLCGTALTVRAQDGDKSKSPGEAQKAPTKADRIAFAKLQIKFHRTLADLIEAQIAEKPDEAKIEELKKALQEVRKEMFEKCPRPRGGRGMGPGPGGPWGQQGMGPGRQGGRPGPGGPGMGPGPNCPWGEPGMGPGPGSEGDRPGPGMGPGPRGDRGQGRGPGPGRQGGRGPGFGQGRGGPNGGPGMPPGPPPREPDPDDGGN